MVYRFSSLRKRRSLRDAEPPSQRLIHPERQLYNGQWECRLCFSGWVSAAGLKRLPATQFNDIVSAYQRRWLFQVEHYTELCGALGTSQQYFLEFQWRWF